MLSGGTHKGGGKGNLLTIEETAKLLRVKPKTIRNWISKGTFGPQDGLTHAGGRPLIFEARLRERLRKDALKIPKKSNGNGN